MSQPSSVESPNATASIDRLHPMVQSTLENLDVQLEEELRRYRRQRHFAAQDWRNKIADRLEQHPEYHLGYHHYVPNSVTGLTQPSGDRQTVQSPRHSITQPISRTVGLSQDQSVTQPTNPATFIDETAEDPVQMERQPSLLDTLLTPLGVGSMVLLLLSSASLGFAMMNPASVSGIFDRLSPTDQSTAIDSTSETAPALEPDLENTGSNLFATDTVTPGLNLSNLSTLPSGSRRGQLPLTPSPKLNQDVAVDRGPRLTPKRFSSAIAQPQAAGLPLSNHLPAPSFYNSPPDSWSPANAPASTNAPTHVPSYTPTHVPAVVPEPPTAAPAPVVTRRQPEPTASTARTSAPPKPEIAPIPAAAPTVAAIEPPPPPPTSLERAYHVDTRYLGDSSLEQARQVAPAANLYNGQDGANIRLNSFATEVEAQQYAQELEQQGIQAQVKAGD